MEKLEELVLMLQSWNLVDNKMCSLTEKNEHFALGSHLFIGDKK